MSRIKGVITFSQQAWIALRAPLLEVEELAVSYPAAGGWARAVRSVSLCLVAGETVALVGETGCGKTSVALALAGLLELNAFVTFRRLAFDGRALRRRRDWDSLRGTRLALAFQDAHGSLNPVLTVGTQLLHTLRAHQRLSRREARVRSMRLLQEVGLPEPDSTMRCYPFELSGGMCQRVGIALALCNHPSLFIADEPTSALDPTVQLQILGLLRMLRASHGLAILLVSHDLPLVAAFADRAAVMYHGSLVEVGPADEVLRQPAHPYTRLLRDSLPMGRPCAETRLPVIPGSPPSPMDEPIGCSFEPRCPVSEGQACRERRPGLVRIAQERRVACIKAS